MFSFWNYDQHQRRLPMRTFSLPVTSILSNTPSISFSLLLSHSRYITTRKQMNRKKNSSNSVCSVHWNDVYTPALICRRIPLYVRTVCFAVLYSSSEHDSLRFSWFIFIVSFRTRTCVANNKHTDKNTVAPYGTQQHDRFDPACLLFNFSSFYRSKRSCSALIFFSFASISRIFLSNLNTTCSQTERVFKYKFQQFFLLVMKASRNTYCIASCLEVVLEKKLFLFYICCNENCLRLRNRKLQRSRKTWEKKNIRGKRNKIDVFNRDIFCKSLNCETDFIAKRNIKANWTYYCFCCEPNKRLTIKQMTKRPESNGIEQ